MNRSKEILEGNFLDLLFYGRNKLYGAYELRKKYSRRLTIALITVFCALVLTFVTAVVYEWISNVINKNKKVEVKSVVLEDIKMPEEKKIIEPPPPPPKPKEIKIKTIKVTPPKIVPDEEVVEPPPTIEQFKDAKISTFTQEGINDDGIIVPEDDGVGDGPKIVEEDPILEKVEKIAEFPGGAKAWLRFVEREIQKYIDELTDAAFSGTVEVQFIVDKKGKVSDVKALTNPGTKLAEIAVEAIKRGPNWIPAMNNGKNVTSYRTQPVTFRLEEE